jgi:epoxyqueuosine reductase QueG
MSDFKDTFKEKNIELYSAIRLDEALVSRPKKLSDAGLSGELSVLMFAVPYYFTSGINISAYAVGKDYHAYFKNLFSKLIPCLAEQFPGYIFAPFADNSAIHEKPVAEQCGIGSIGDNKLILTKKYSSFIFLGEVISNLPAESYGLPRPTPTENLCIHCGKCREVCPTGFLRGEYELCYSAITQKKGELAENEKEFIKKLGSVWGCDVCQNVCPVTLAAKAQGSLETHIPYFRCDILKELSTDVINKMSDEEFGSRAYSWRGKETLLRNTEVLGC